MREPSHETLSPLVEQLDAMGFAELPGLAARVELVNRIIGSRAYSHGLAEIWADWFAAHPGLAPDTTQRILREMLRLSPNLERSEDIYRALATPSEPLQPADEPVFVIVSCAKYLARARALRRELVAHGASAWIVTGDPQRPLPVWDDEGVVVPTDDTYEALPLKVAAGVGAAVHRFGRRAVVKIDDDCRLTSDFSVETFRRIGRQHEYVGVPINDPRHDRLWHLGKTSRDVGLYTRRYNGPWARGGCYLLGPRASDLVAREVVLYPGEFSVEHYEDKAIGDFLRRQGVALTALPGDAAWGIAVDLRERIEQAPLPADADSIGPRQTEPVNAEPVVAAHRRASGGQEPSAVTSQPANDRRRIPKVLHLTWVGDDSKRPDNCIKTWVEQNPGWTVHLWGNDDLRTSEWVNARHIKAMWNRELNGVADLMRWEILYNHGGIVVDADSICVRPLDDWLLEADAIACWENEITRPRLIGCNMVGSVPENPFFGQIINDLRERETVVEDMAWKTVGPLCLTTAFFKYRYTGLTILPSHFFIPDHFSGVHYSGGGIVYAKQEWASTHHAYDTLHLKTVA